MELNVGVIKSVLNLYEEMHQCNMDVVYLGEFNHDITKMFANMADNKMELNEEDRITKKKVYHVLVETLQNLNKHSDWVSDKRHIGSGLFMIGKKDNTHYIITSNRVTLEKKAVLEEQIKIIKSANQDTLKEMYKTQLKDGKLSEKGGAGLGLIDIARKANMDFYFIPLDKESALFILKAEIQSSKIEE